MRATNGAARHRAKKRLFRKVKGYYGARKRLLRTAHAALMRARRYAYRHRRLRKRDFRRLWILRINAACRMRDITYSQFMHGLSLAGVELDRKSLSELAIHDPEAFEQLVAESRAQRQGAAAAVTAVAG